MVLPEQGGSSRTSFHPFSFLPAEIRNEIWRICVKEYPSRIVDLREYRRPILQTFLQTVLPKTHPPPKALSDACPYNFITEIVEFKSRVAPPTTLHICQDSRPISRGLYTKAFGTAEMPAETWINFEKDMLYIHIDFCYIGLERSRIPDRSSFFRFFTRQKKPYGYFLKEFRLEVQKVKDLAISGIWTPGSRLPWDTDTDFMHIHH